MDRALSLLVSDKEECVELCQDVLEQVHASAVGCPVDARHAPVVHGINLGVNGAYQ